MSLSPPRSEEKYSSRRSPVNDGSSSSAVGSEIAVTSTGGENRGTPGGPPPPASLPASGLELGEGTMPSRSVDGAQASAGSTASNKMEHWNERHASSKA